MYSNFGRIKNSFFVLFFAFLLFTCSGKNQDEVKESANELSPLYIIKYSGQGPFYFELSPAGPVLIPSPAEASLTPFIPWTHSRHISQILPVCGTGEHKGETLYAAINRGGILELRNGDGAAAVYYYPGGESWESFLLAAFFRYNQKPAALLTTERFFSAEEKAPESSAVWTMSNLSLEGLIIPALNADKTSAWDTSAVLLGRDGIWYFRKINSMGKSAYFRTADLSQPGEEINAEQYLEASLPISVMEVNAASVPPLLAWAVTEAARLAESPCIADIVSPEFPARRIFSSKGIGQAGETEVYPREAAGYYRPPSLDSEELVVILFPDGRGVYGRSVGDVVKDGHFKLPALPSDVTGNFVYTGVALLGDGPELFLMAAWEEQKDWNVGAAGFLLLEIGW